MLKHNLRDLGRVEGGSVGAGAGGSAVFSAGGAGELSGPVLRVGDSPPCSAGRQSHCVAEGRDRRFEIADLRVKGDGRLIGRGV